MKELSLNEVQAVSGGFLRLGDLITALPSYSSVVGTLGGSVGSAVGGIIGSVVPVFGAAIGSGIGNTIGTIGAQFSARLTETIFKRKVEFLQGLFGRR